jgi:diguanylate cyclase (GGDEF)-like protein
MAKGEVLGLLHIGVKHDAKDPERLVEEFKETSGVLSELLSLSIANIKLRETLSNQSIRDPLTGLFNRRYMEETLRLELLKSIRKGTGLGIIMADIDHFKEFNDSHGHGAGDTLLVLLSAFLTKKMRASDVICRYGGEEFLILLPETSLEDAVKRAENIREEIKTLIVEYRGQVLGNVTLSLGVSAYPDHGAESEHLLMTADAALYRAKNEGRDRVVSA